MHFQIVCTSALALLRKKIDRLWLAAIKIRAELLLLVVHQLQHKLWKNEDENITQAPESHPEQEPVL